MSVEWFAGNVVAVFALIVMQLTSAEAEVCDRQLLAVGKSRCSLCCSQGKQTLSSGIATFRHSFLGSSSISTGAASMTDSDQGLAMALRCVPKVCSSLCRSFGEYNNFVATCRLGLV